MKISPKDTVMLQSVAPITYQDLQFVLRLYQPLMEPVGFSLYALIGDLAQEKEQPIMKVSDLEMLLGCGLQAFYDAKRKLEALGLLRTFYAKQGTNYYVYELQKPLTPTQFFKEDMLRLLLLQFVGEQQYQCLVDKFVTVKSVEKGLTEVSCNLLDVFSLAPQQLQQNLKAPQTEETAQVEFPKIVGDFDKEFFYDLVKNSFVLDEVVLAKIERLSLLKALYGLTEQQLVSLLEASWSIQDNDIDWAGFEKRIQEQYDWQLKVTDETVMNAEVKQSQNISNNENQELLKACRYYRPVMFLQIIRNKSASSQEVKLLENALKMVPAEVVNIVIHYAIINQEYSVLNEKYFTKIIADMKANNIMTAQQAMNKVQDFYAKIAQTKTAVSFKKTVRQKGKLPKWATNPESIKIEQENVPSSAELAEKLRRLDE